MTDLNFSLIIRGGEKATTNKDIVVTLQEAAGKVHTPEKEQDIGGEGNELQVYLRDHIKEADLVHTHTHTHILAGKEDAMA